MHTKINDEILRLAKYVSKTGESILKLMALAYPYNGSEIIKDQFMLGDNILVASIVEKNARKLNEVFPKGNWKGDDSKNVKEVKHLIRSTS